LDRLNIEHGTIEHPPMFKVEEGRPLHDKMAVDDSRTSA
jgi:hypothetical protein